MKIITSRDKDGQEVFRILVNGRLHPATFVTEKAAVAQLGLLAQRGLS